PPDCWTGVPDAPWSPLQRALIDSMPGERVVPRAFAIAGSTLPRRYAGAHVERIPADPRTSALACLMAPERSQPASLQLFHAGGRDAEIEEVFRRILASGRSLDQVEITCATDEYATLVWEQACRYGWPITISRGVGSAGAAPPRGAASRVSRPSPGRWPSRAFVRAARSAARCLWRSTSSESVSRGSAWVAIEPGPATSTCPDWHKPAFRTVRFFLS